MKAMNNNLGSKKLIITSVMTALLILKGNLAGAANGAKDISNSEISAGEVLMMVAGIVLLILVAWFFGSGQSAKEELHHDHHHPHLTKHYENKSDPYFRKLKKKTS